MQNGVGQIHNFNHIDKNGGWIYTKLLPVTDGPSGLRVKAVGSRGGSACVAGDRDHPWATVLSASGIS